MNGLFAACVAIAAAAVPDAAGASSASDVRGTVTLVQAMGKPARCEWNDGNGGPTERYACQFLSSGGNGSFSVIREDGYELMLEVESPGMGTLAEFGDGRLVGDFGRVRRSESDPACWEAENGTARLCAR